MQRPVSYWRQRPTRGGRPAAYPANCSGAAIRQSSTVPVPSSATFAGGTLETASSAMRTGWDVHQQASFRSNGSCALEGGRNKIGGKVVDMLDADREAEQARRNAGEVLCRVIHRGVGHGWRVGDETFNAAKGFREAETFKAVDEAADCALAAGQFERDQRAKSILLLTSDGMTRMGVTASGVMNIPTLRDAGSAGRQFAWHFPDARGSRASSVRKPRKVGTSRTAPSQAERVSPHHANCSSTAGSAAITAPRRSGSARAIGMVGGNALDLGGRRSTRS